MGRSGEAGFTKRVERPRDPMIDIHIRISRKLVFWTIAIVVLLFVFSWAFMIAGHSSGGVEISPVQQQQSP